MFMEELSVLRGNDGTEQEKILAKTLIFSVQCRTHSSEQVAVWLWVLLLPKKPRQAQTVTVEKHSNPTDSSRYWRWRDRNANLSVKSAIDALMSSYWTLAGRATGMSPNSPCPTTRHRRRWQTPCWTCSPQGRRGTKRRWEPRSRCTRRLPAPAGRGQNWLFRV